MEYVLHILVLFGIYAALSISLDILAGNLGLLSIAHAAFYGLGAYTAALLTVDAGAPFLVGIVVGMLVAAGASLLVSLPSMRLHDDYFIIATFGFQMILFSIFNNWTEATRGPLGIPGIPQPVILGWEVDTSFEFIILAAALATFAYLVVWRLTSSPFGRVLRAIREDEVVAKAVGKNTLRFKVTAFAVSAAFGGVGRESVRPLHHVHRPDQLYGDGVDPDHLDGHHRRGRQPVGAVDWGVCVGDAARGTTFCRLAKCGRCEPAADHLWKPLGHHDDDPPTWPSGKVRIRAVRDVFAGRQ